MELTRRAVQLFAFASGLAISSWAPIVPFAKTNLDMNDATLGFVLLALGIGGLIVMPITGWLVQRFGARKVLLPAGLSLIPLLPLLVLAPTPLTLGLVLLFYGCALGVLNVGSNIQAIAVEAHFKYPLMSGIHCLFSLGGLVGAATVSLLLESGLQLITTTLIIAAILSTIVLTQYKHLQGVIENHETSKNISDKTPAKFTFPSRMVLFLSSLCFILFLAEGMVLDWSAVFLRSTYDYEISIAGIGYAFFSVAMSIGRWFGDKIVQRLGAIPVIRMGSLLAAAGLLIVLNFHWAHLELLGFFILGIGAANIVPILFSAAGRIPNISPTYALTTMTTLGYTGLLLGPTIIGCVAEAFSLSLALTGVAFLLIAVGISAPFIKISQTDAVVSAES